jgi:hypothetical protein
VPPLDAAPSCPDVLRRSASSFSTSSFKESSRGGRNRPHRRGYLAGNELLRHRNSSSPAILRPSQPHRRVPGELLVRPPPFPLLLPRRSRRHGRPPEMPGSRSAWAVAQPTRLAWPAYVARAPSVSFSGSNDPGCKKSLQPVFHSRNFRKVANLVKL